MITTSHQTKWIVSHNLRKIRREKELTQTDLAKELGITRAAIGSYEEHRAEVPLHLIINFCRIFQIDIEKFVTRKI